MEYNIEYVKKMYDNYPKVKYLFFWGHHPSNDGYITKSCLSQWYECSFVVDGITYHTAEQYMMAQKSKLFNDSETLQKIMKANHPNEFKKLGRQVKNFDIDIWESKRYDIVLNGNLNKFSQNEDIKEYLLNTQTRILVEASPYDNIWGIGLGATTPNIENPYTWQGLNLLGFALMQVRDALIYQL